MNILITGGLGYVGSSLIPVLYEKGFVKKIIIYDNLSNKNYELFFSTIKMSSKVKFIEGSVLDNHSLKEILKDEKIDTIIHLAAKTSTPMSDYGFHKFDQINHWGTSILVDAIEKANTVKTVIFVSSFSVYGTYKKLFNEHDEAIPQSNYGKSKFLGEREVWDRLPSTINKIILRTGVLFGGSKGYKPTTVLNKFLFDAHFFNKIQIFGTGTQRRPFIHLERFNIIIVKILETSNLEKGIYNIFDYNISINELSKKFSILYPKMELIFMNRDHEMKSIEMDSVYNINEILELEDTKEIEDYLLECKSLFSF